MPQVQPTGQNTAVNVNSEKAVHSHSIWNKNHDYTYYLTDSSTGDLPQTGGHRGALFFMMDNDPRGNQSPADFSGIQYWYDLDNGDIWARKVYQAEGLDDSTATYHSWNKMTSGTGMTFDEYVKKPERGQKVESLDNILDSGLYRTNGDIAKNNPDVRRTYPEVDNYWGTLIVLYENDGRGENPEASPNGSQQACIQLFFAMHDSQNRIMHIRKKSSGNWSRWAMLGGSGGGPAVLPDDYFPSTDTDPITDASSFTYNGFKKTTVDTAGLPDFEDDLSSRIGVIQFISENEAGEDTGIQYYVPIQGKYAGQTFTRVKQNVEVTRKGARITSTKWSEWNADGTNSNDLKINFNNVNTPTDPLEFLVNNKQKFQQRVFYNYFWKSALNMESLPQIQAQDFIVRTMVLAVDHPTVSGRQHQFVEQTAFGRNGEVLTRVSKPDLSNSQFSWGEWNILSEKGETMQISVIDAHYQSEFTQWASTADR